MGLDVKHPGGYANGQWGTASLAAIDPSFHSPELTGKPRQMNQVTNGGTHASEKTNARVHAGTVNSVSEIGTGDCPGISRVASRGEPGEVLIYSARFTS